MWIAPDCIRVPKWFFAGLTRCQVGVEACATAHHWGECTSQAVESNLRDLSSSMAASARIPGQSPVRISGFPMKIAVVTLFTEEIADYGKIGAANKRAYALRHGYDCFIYREQLDRSRHPAWSKIDAIKRHLPNYDWVFWTDADSLVMDDERTLESIIIGHENKDMILTWDIGASPVNSGEWLIRNTAWSASALSAIGDIACPNPFPMSYEQGALVTWLELDKTRWSHLAVLHPRVMNATPPVMLYDKNEYMPTRISQFQRGDFIIHFWPLARRPKSILDMMVMYDALSKRRLFSFAWRASNFYAWFAVRSAWRRLRWAIRPFQIQRDDGSGA